MFILVHAVLPHSHHDGVVCFSLEEITHECLEHNHQDNSCHSHSHHHENSEDCDLKDLVLRQHDTHEEIIPCADCLSLLYTIDLLSNLHAEADRSEEILQLKPYLETYIPPFVGSIKSLRAPPYFS